jgi:hypothetical protein
MSWFIGIIGLMFLLNLSMRDEEGMSVATYIELAVGVVLILIAAIVHIAVHTKLLCGG